MTPAVKIWTMQSKANQPSEFIQSITAKDRSCQLASAIFFYLLLNPLIFEYNFVRFYHAQLIAGNTFNVFIGINQILQFVQFCLIGLCLNQLAGQSFIAQTDPFDLVFLLKIDRDC